MPPVELRFDERDPVKLWASLKDAFAKLRGFDIVKSPGKNVRIPRTTGDDARLLIAQWNQTTIEYGLRLTTGAFTGEVESNKARWRKIVEKWEPARDEMIAQATIDGAKTFTANPRLWDTTAKLAIELSALGSLPSPWALIVESVEEAVIEAPGVIAGVVKGASKAAARAAGAIVGAFLEGLWVPVAIGAGIYVLVKRKGR